MGVDYPKLFAYMKRKGYIVTDDGRFFNHKGVERQIYTKSNHKYPQSQIYFEGKRVNYQYHRFAAYCFYGEDMFNDGIVVRHLNGDTLDISRQNIALGTYSDNEKDKSVQTRKRVASQANRKRKTVERYTMRKFTPEQVRYIRELSAKGVKGVDSARQFSVTKDTIYQILRGETYKDIK